MEDKEKGGLTVKYKRELKRKPDFIKKIAFYFIEENISTKAAKMIKSQQNLEGFGGREFIERYKKEIKLLRKNFHNELLS